MLAFEKHSIVGNGNDSWKWDWGEAVERSWEMALV